jgi:CheY-like chemotaxis protein
MPAFFGIEPFELRALNGDMVRDGGLVEVAIDPKKRGLGKTVLVVDDSEVLRKAIEKAFLSDGFKTCVEAENGQEAIEVAKECQPDLIILDLSMPVMNGLQAAPILRGMFPKVPLQFQAGYVNFRQPRTAGLFNIEHYVPFDGVHTQSSP